jgi:predicted nucleic acid-binding protein
MEIVVNSWFSEYLKASAKSNEVELFDSFVKKLLQSENLIVTISNAQLEEKLRKLEKNYQNHRDVKFITKIKFIYRNIYLNPTKCKILSRPELNEDLNSIFESSNHLTKDRFLFEAAIQTEERIIVTADSKLKERMDRVEGMRIFLLQEYLDQF